MFLPVSILPLGMVRHAWSSYIPQGCYIVNQLAAPRFELATCIFRVPCVINSATTSPPGLYRMCSNQQRLHSRAKKNDNDRLWSKFRDFKIYYHKQLKNAQKIYI